MLLVAGLGDPARHRSHGDGLADRYRVTAFDSCDVGRPPLPESRFR